MEPLLDGADIQGNILPGFNRQERYLVGFTCNDGARLKNALALVLPHVTTMLQALDHRDERKAAFVAAEPPPLRKDLWLNIALGPRAVRAIGADAVFDLDDEEFSFAGGMTPGITGDASAPTLPNGDPNPASRRHWKVGSPSRPLDLLLIFANDGAIEERAAPLLEAIASALGVAPTYDEVGRLIPGEIEHFGFRDGISQPGVRGRVMHQGTERFVTTRYGVPSAHGVDFGKPGQPLVWPGQFLTGQPVSEGDQPSLPAELTNGSFGVFRRLSQNVRAFYEDTEALAGQLSAATGIGLAPDRLRTLMVGRFPTGAALMRHDQQPAQDDSITAINYFAFADALPEITLTDGSTVSAAKADPDVLRGRRCPVWAHIRKVNPRDLGTNRGGPIDTIGFQILRRGIPFGPPYDHLNPKNPDNDNKQRGLLFLSYQRHIKTTFSILNHDWMNNRDAPQGGGFDLLVGQNVPNNGDGRHANKSATFFGPPPDTSTVGVDFESQRQWVVPTGGAFVFAPSLAFVKKFAAELPS